MRNIKEEVTKVVGARVICGETVEVGGARMIGGEREEMKGGGEVRRIG